MFFEDAKTASRDLRRHLEGCTEILLFACTAGSEMDRRISRKLSVSGYNRALGNRDISLALDELFSGRSFPAAMIRRIERDMKQKE